MLEDYLVFQHVSIEAVIHSLGDHGKGKRGYLHHPFVLFLPPYILSYLLTGFMFSGVGSLFSFERSWGSLLHEGTRSFPMVLTGRAY